MSDATKSENIRKILNQFMGSSEGLGGDELAKLSAENRELRARAEADKKTIATLRESKALYQENYRKAKAAYEKLRAGG